MRRVLALAVSAAIALSMVPLSQAGPLPSASASSRVFPEPLETTDFVGIREFYAGIDKLAKAHPDVLVVREVGSSFGIPTATGGRAQYPIVAVEVTNDKSATPRDEKPVLIFQLSIHGNEKGGREGGMRVIEDLAAGHYYDEAFRAAILDQFLLVFTFPNVDGWAHEELEHRLGDPVNTGYTRGNGNGRDLNRDFPSMGWYQSGGGRGPALSEPEIAGLAPYYLQFKGRAMYATDIHGMLHPADSGILFAGYGKPIQCLPRTSPFLGGTCLREGHFVLSLIPSAQETPTGHLRNVRLAENVKERLNAMASERYPWFSSLPNVGLAGGNFNEYGTTWDTIGYTDSGTTGEFFAQFVEAEGFDFELAYNHITFDDNYVAILNDMHVHTVREIVRSYVETAQQKIFALVQANGHKLAYLVDPLATDVGAAPEGLADSAAVFERKVRADLNEFWADMANVVDGPVAGLSATDVAAGRLSDFDRFAVGGRAAESLLSNAAAVSAMKAWVEAGGRLVVTDGALALAHALGAVAADEVKETTGYLGYANIVGDHALAKGVRGLARELYSGITIGYDLRGSAPIWTIAATAVESAGGAVAGTSGSTSAASLGTLPLGKGEIVFLGALLAPPTTEHDPPYGLASYAVTATGYQVLYNALGFTLVESQEPRGLLDGVLNPTGGEEPASVPGLEPVILLAAVGALAVAARRRRT